eukprot:CAMPEP_0203992138 /NCGR_PEP_ID=MMETSP0360-20130528/9891_1 /ASSEMBLY_ACC=CAM_ASM_000342 /TAXON_ID=268821 /ORGANISM="Scrippsiella Hangoei, Strain SHTV-5" /LENGTH=59 /DNA_ID=CAMNT_0050932407 /DNA_START=13 /DNA_END=188 /DNA_ORIENTATION=-
MAAAFANRSTRFTSIGPSRRWHSGRRRAAANEWAWLSTERSSKSCKLPAAWMIWPTKSP